MGYDIHITRKESWSDEDPKNEITLEEWNNYVSGDSEMRRDDSAESITLSGETVLNVNDGLAVWTRYSQHGINDNYAWFDFRQGKITVKNPDAEIRNKMIDIAIALKAKVQGDDDEIYSTKETITGKRPWWQFWNKL